MQTNAFMRFLADNRMPVFTFDDVIKILHVSRNYAKLFLHRCVGKGLIKKAERGVYYVSNKANEYEVASHILAPSYISMISALSYYGLTTQIPTIVYVISTKRHMPIKNILGFEIRFRKINERMMFGYHKEADGNIFIADPEKAVVDILYFNDVNDLDEDVLERPARLDVGKLMTYAIRSRKGTVITKIGDLLREHGYRSEARRLMKEGGLVKP